MGHPFDDAGIEEMADWMAPRLGQSPMYQMAIDAADPDLLAVLLERLMNEYLEYREIPARVRRDRNLVYVSMGEDDDDGGIGSQHQRTAGARPDAPPPRLRLVAITGATVQIPWGNTSFLRKQEPRTSTHRQS